MEKTAALPLKNRADLRAGDAGENLNTSEHKIARDSIAVIIRRIHLETKKPLPAEQEFSNLRAKAITDIVSYARKGTREGFYEASKLASTYLAADTMEKELRAAAKNGTPQVKKGQLDKFFSYHWEKCRKDFEGVADWK